VQWSTVKQSAVRQQLAAQLEQRQGKIPAER
jgi:hypothetical protein